MSNTLDGLQLAEVRRELALLVAMADTAERPKPDVINPPDHGMPGLEWRVQQHARVDARRPPLWVVRTVDEPEFRDSVYVAEPDRTREYDWMDRLDFTAMEPVDARRLAMALLAAADRADHLTAGVPRLEDRRRRNSVTLDHLRDVATIYRNAVKQGEAPTAAVAKRFEASHSTAGRWVGLARSEGLLGATSPGRASD